MSRDGQQIGDGLVARVCREIQKHYWRPPLDTGRCRWKSLAGARPNHFLDLAPARAWIFRV